MTKYPKKSRAEGSCEGEIAFRSRFENQVRSQRKIFLLHQRHNKEKTNQWVSTARITRLVHNHLIYLLYEHVYSCSFQGSSDA